MDGVAEREEQDAGEFAGMKARIERFETVNLLADGLRARAGLARGASPRYRRATGPACPAGGSGG